MLERDPPRAQAYLLAPLDGILAPQPVQAGRNPREEEAGVCTDGATVLPHPKL